MTIFRLHLSGEVRKPIVRDYDGKKILSFQIMKKNYNKDKIAEASYTWINVTVFDAKPFQVQNFTEKAFVSGSGEFTLRSYVDNAGNKRQSADVRCNSMDIDSAYVERDSHSATSPAPTNAPPSAPDSDEPPF